MNLRNLIASFGLACCVSMGWVSAAETGASGASGNGLTRLSSAPEVLGAGWQGPTGIVVDNLNDLSQVPEQYREMARRIQADSLGKGIVGCADFTYTQPQDERKVSIKVFVFESALRARAYWMDTFGAQPNSKFFRTVSNVGDAALDSKSAPRRIVLAGRYFFTAQQGHFNDDYIRLLNRSMEKLQNTLDTSVPQVAASKQITPPLPEIAGAAELAPVAVTAAPQSVSLTDWTLPAPGLESDKKYSVKLNDFSRVSEILGEGWNAKNMTVVESVKKLDPNTKKEADSKGVKSCANFDFVSPDGHKIALKAFLFKDIKSSQQYWASTFGGENAKFFSQVNGVGDAAVDSLKNNKRMVRAGNLLFTCSQDFASSDYKNVVNRCLEVLSGKTTDLATIKQLREGTAPRVEVAAAKTPSVPVVEAKAVAIERPVSVVAAPVVEAAPAWSTRASDFHFQGRLSDLKEETALLGSSWKGPLGLVVNDFRDTSGYVGEQREKVFTAIRQGQPIGLTGCADFTYTDVSSGDKLSMKVFSFDTVRQAQAYWSKTFETPTASNFFTWVYGVGDRALDYKNSNKRVTLMGNLLFTCQSTGTSDLPGRVISHAITKAVAAKADTISLAPTGR